MSYVPSFCYSETKESFIFSLRRARGISDAFGKLKDYGPFICPVKLKQTKMAIKQSEQDYSPGFGETNKCDLFLAFKNLDMSYCRIGNIYQVPA